MPQGKILSCTCVHEFQDAEHDGKRVHNATLSKMGDKRVYRCTVCTNERTT